MKKRRDVLLLFAACVFLLCATASFAAPFYVTVSGSITSLYDYDGDLAGTYAVGNTVNAIFMFDRQEDGYNIDNNGNVITQMDDVHQDSYLAEFIGGDSAGVDSDLTYRDSLHYGYDYVNTDTNGGNYYSNALICDQDNSLNGSYTYIARYIYLDNTLGSFSTHPSLGIEYIVGDRFEMFSYDGSNSEFNADVAITAVSDINPYDAAPVPEPATLFLLGSGLAGFAGLKKRRK